MLNDPNIRPVIIKYIYIYINILYTHRYYLIHLLFSIKVPSISPHPIYISHVNEDVKMALKILILLRSLFFVHYCKFVQKVKMKKIYLLTIIDFVLISRPW